MTVLITITNVGNDLNLFDIYSDVNGYISAFESNVTKQNLIAGFASNNVPEGTTIVRVKSKGTNCNSFVDVQL